MRESTYLQVQEDLTTKALRLLRLAETAASEEKFDYLKRYQQLCTAARRLRRQYAEQQRREQHDQQTQNHQED